MNSFSAEIYRVVNAGLADLATSQQAGKTPINPLSETHFFSAWVTKALKNHRFDICAVVSLKHWQQQARTLGRHALLKQQFVDLVYTLRPIFDAEGANLGVNQTAINQVLTSLSDEQWLVTTDVPVGKKVNVKSGGAASLVICPQKFKQCFNQSLDLVKPLSIYLRGDSQAVINFCHQHQMLLHKVTDYKSQVKYHGEYVIHPANSGNDLPCVALI